MKIGVLFFGVLKEVIGRSGETVDLPEGARVSEVPLSREAAPDQAGTDTVRLNLLPGDGIELVQPIRHRLAQIKAAAAERRVALVDEVALLPPVSGGSAEAGGEVRGEVRIVHERIDTETVVGRLKQPADGAAVIFDGVVRDNTRGRRTLYLDYEAYDAMALKRMESLAVEARSRFSVPAVSIVHRLGRLEIGETSVLIAVAAAHRGAAFEACRWIIDTLKKTVPIWKKEYFEDGAVWADGEAFPEEIRSPGGTAGKQPASK